MHNRLLTFILIGCVLISQEVNATDPVPEKPVVVLKNTTTLKPVETKPQVQQSIDKTATPIIKPTVEPAVKLAPADKPTSKEFAQKSTERKKQSQSKKAPKKSSQQHAHPHKNERHAMSQKAGQHYESQKAGQHTFVLTKTRPSKSHKSSTVKPKSIQHRNEVHH